MMMMMTTMMMCTVQACSKCCTDNKCNDFVLQGFDESGTSNLLASLTLLAIMAAVAMVM